MLTLCREHKELFRSHLGAEQYAVSVKVALEKLAATLKVTLDQHPDDAVLRIDAVSTFNNMLREVMLEELEASCPQLLTIFAQGLTRDLTIVLVIDQLCLGLPIAFACGMRRAPTRIRERMLDARRNSAGTPEESVHCHSAAFSTT